MLARAIVLGIVLGLAALVVGCETPRDRACRSLAVQAANADDVRKTTYADPRVGAQRAESAARWLASNAVDDAGLAAQRDELVAALRRLANARTRLADAKAVLRGNDVPDLVERAQRLLRWDADAHRAMRLETRCPERNPFAYANINDACALGERYGGREDFAPLPLHERASWYAESVEIDLRLRPEDVAGGLRVSLRADATWFAENLRDVDSLAAVRAASAAMVAVGDRGRADEDVARLAAPLRTRCGR